jgi:hypothetical protein
MNIDVDKYIPWLLRITPKGFVKGGIPYVRLYAGDRLEPNATIEMPLKDWFSQVATWESDEKC